MSSYKLTSTRKNEDVISILDEVNRKEGIKVTDGNSKIIEYTKII